MTSTPSTAATAGEYDGSDPSVSPANLPPTSATDLSELILQTFREMTGDPSVTAQTDLFDTGADSLVAAQVVRRLNRGAGIPVTLADIFTFSTPYALARHIEAQSVGRVAAETEPAPDRQRMELTLLQQHRLAQWPSRPPAKVLCRVLRLTGPLERNDLEVACRRLVHRHAALRLEVDPTSDGPQLSLRSRVVTPLVWHDLTGQGSDAPETADRLVSQALQEGFDLTAAPLARVMVMRLAVDVHLVAVLVEHLVADAESLNILAADLGHLYDSATEPDPGEDRSFLRFVATQQALLRERSEADVDHWRGRQVHELSPAAMTAMGWKDAGPASRAVLESRPLHPQALEATLTATRSLGLTAHMTYLATLTLALRCSFGPDPVPIVTPIANRAPGHEEAVGWYAHGLRVTLDHPPEASLAEFLEAARHRFVDDLRHASLPHTTIAGLLKPPGGETNPRGTVPGFYLMSDTAPRTSRWRGLTVEELPDRTYPLTNGNISFSVTTNGPSPRVSAYYGVDYWPGSLIGRVCDDFSSMVHRIPHHLGTPVGQLLRPAGRQTGTLASGSDPAPTVRRPGSDHHAAGGNVR